MADDNEERALVQSQEHALNPYQYQPKDLTEVGRFAEMVVKANLWGKKNPSEVATIVIAGNEIGLSAVQSLSGIDVIHGKPALSGQLMIALVKRSPVCEYFVIAETTDARCVIRTKRKGEPESERTITMKEARESGWHQEWDRDKKQMVEKANWKKFPRVMLKWRVVSEICRDVYPDVLKGLHSVEELQDSAGIWDDRREPPKATTQAQAGKHSPAPKAETKTPDDSPPPSTTQRPYSPNDLARDLGELDIDVEGAIVQRIREARFDGKDARILTHAQRRELFQSARAYVEWRDAAHRAGVDQGEAKKRARAEGIDLRTWDPEAIQRATQLLEDDAGDEPRVMDTTAEVANANA